MNSIPFLEIHAIVGLGNPGPHYYKTRHNIGFLILDALAQKYGCVWQHKNNMEIAELTHAGRRIYLIKPQTYMNESGKIVPFLTKKGIKADQVLVVHDELEQSFGVIKTRVGGSARGHNGLKSIIAAYGDDTFARIRFGIARPERKEDVPTYVLESFKEPQVAVNSAIEQAVALIKKIIGLGERHSL